MSEIVDLSNLVAKASAIHSDVEEMDAALMSAHYAEIGRIQDFARLHPDSPLAKANEHLLQRPGTHRPAAPGQGQNERLALAAAEEERWKGGGGIAVAATGKFAIGGSILFAPPYGFKFTATGWDWAVGTFSAAVVGTFVVEPKIARSKGQLINGHPTVPCRFQLSVLGAGPAGLTLLFYSVDGTYWGLFGGAGVGVAVMSIKGEGTMEWS